MADNYVHAFSNTKGWFEEIRDAYREHDTADENRQGEIIDEMMERPLSVQIRSPWYTPSEKVPAPAEYEILLTTGGPALRVWGELDNYGGVSSAELQMQDWGVPWRAVWPCEVAEMDEARAVLLWFAGLCTTTKSCRLRRRGYCTLRAANENTVEG